jgi:hypothetical protein
MAANFWAFAQWIVSSAILIGAIAWLARSLIGHFLTRDVEKFKHQLSTASELEKEKLRNDLRRIAYEHEVTFSKLHTERAEIIKMTHSLLVDLIDALDSMLFLSGFTNEEERAADRTEKARLAHDALVDYHNKNRIFLPPELAGQIFELISEFGSTYVTHRIGLTHPDPNGITPERGAANRKRLRDAATKVGTELENEFRRLLGVDVSARKVESVGGET